MCGSETTRGLSRKRSSASASGTTKTSDCKMAVAQKAMFRDVSEASKPTRDLNHWRFSAEEGNRGDGGVAKKGGQRRRLSEDLSGVVDRVGEILRATVRASL